MARLMTTLMMIALGAGGYPTGTAGDAKAADLLRQARAALGGARALDDVRTLTASGTLSRAIEGRTRLDGDVTLQIQLPDRMLRTDSFSPDGAATLISEQGLNGGTLLRAARALNTPPGMMMRTPPSPVRGSDAEAQALRAARADFARLVIALLMKPADGLSVEFTYGGVAEAPDGKADVLDVKAADGSSFAARLFLDAASHRPLMLSYRGVAPRMVMQTQRLEGRRAQNGDQPSPPDAPPAGDVVEIELFLDDYRDVNGVLLPHHITRAVGGDVNEEWTVKSFTINAPFKAGTFDPK